MTTPSISNDLASRATFLSLITNVALMVLKIVIGLVFGSIAVLGDGIDSAEDILASGLAFFTVRLALQPADEEHPFGHGKAEGLAALAQAAFIGGGAAVIAFLAIRRAVEGGVEVYIGPSIATMLIAAAVNLAVAMYSRRAARITGSVAVASDARHLMTNTVQALAIVVALALVGITGDHIYDTLVAILLAVYLLWNAFQILRDALGELLDSALPDEDLSRIRTVLERPRRGVRAYHDLRTRKTGRNVEIAAHVVVDSDLTVRDAHDVTESLESELKATIPNAVVTLHTDPGDAADKPTRAPTPEASAR